MTRMIFSTVRAPHDPALTVESFAMTHTGRPSTVAMPVTTPSAGRSPATTFANRPSSTKDPSSTSRRIRSRANSLPRAALASWYFAPPPCSTCARSSATGGCTGIGLWCSTVEMSVPLSVTRARPLVQDRGTVARLPSVACRDVERRQPGPRPRPQHLRRQPMADDLLGGARHLEQRVEIHTGRDPHVLDHVHEFLRRDVAGGARGVGAAAQPPDRRVEVGHAQLQR